MLRSYSSIKELRESYMNNKQALSDEHLHSKYGSTSNHNMKKLNRPEIITPIDEEDNSVFTSRHHLLLSGEYSMRPSRWKWMLKRLKTVALVVIWIVCSCTLMVKNEKIHVKHHLSVPQNSTKGYIITEPVIPEMIQISLEGALLPQYYANLSIHNMHVWIQLIKTSYRPTNISNLQASDILDVKNISDVWHVPTVSGKLIGNVPEVVHKRIYKLVNTSDTENYSHYFMKVKLKTNLNYNFPISLSYNVDPINEDNGILYAAALLTLLYVLMIFEVIHRTLAAMLVSTMAIAILAALNDRPTMAEIISWIDVETLLLLFSMMTMVALFTETGIFDYMSVLAYKITGGRIWPLINTLCFFTALLSCFLDNVTTALLMTPVTIRLCEVMKLNPVPVLINMIVYSNIGGALTPIGDPPNVIIASNPDVIKAGITFSVFTLHMSIGVFLSLIVVHLQLRYMYRDENSLRFAEPKDVQDLRREIAVWQRAAASMSSYSKDEDAVKDSLMKRTSRLVGKLNTKTCVKDVDSECGRSFNIKDLEAEYPIRDKVLLVKCAFTLFFVITVFFMQTIPALSKLGLGWTALLGALLLLILSERDDIEAVLARVEWSTLLFFASLFILMEALSRLGLIDCIGQLTHSIVMSVGEEARLSVALLLIMWVSAIASAFVDNIPLTTMMIRIATSLAENRELKLPLQPLIWALSFGACLGGNGTLFGSSSNIICAGVAEQHGYRFSFIEFMKLGTSLRQMTHKAALRFGQNARNQLFGAKSKIPMNMLISQNAKSGRLAIIFLGIFTLTMGIIFSSIPWLDYLILKQLRLWNGSLSFQYWQKPGVNRLTKVYIFNVTNPDTFLSHGEKPKLQEIGPFVYREDMEKVNIKFHDNGTVTFQHKKILQFVPELSVNQYEKLTVPNIPLLALSTQSNSLGYFLQKTISFVLSMASHKPFVTLTAEDLVFGYDDSIVTLAHHFYPKHKKPKDNKMGLLNGRNGTLKEVQTIFTGERSMQEFGLMERMNGQDRLPFWDGPCADIQGSEGSFFPPRHFTKKDIVHVFDKDICRILPLIYRHTEIKQGISVDIYTPPGDIFESADAKAQNKCFCPGNQYCPPRGLQSIGPCHFDAPLYVSNPHFYNADSSLLERIEGLSPDSDKHSTYIKIQPKLGVPLEAKVRMQVNLKVDKAPNVETVRSFPSIIFPIMWVEEGISDVTPPIRRWIYLATTFSDMASPLLTYGFIFLGSCVLIGVFINTYKSIVFTKETIEVGMKTFRRGSSFNNRLLIVRDSYTLLQNLPEQNEMV